MGVGPYTAIACDMTILSFGSLQLLTILIN